VKRNTLSRAARTEVDENAEDRRSKLPIVEKACCRGDIENMHGCFSIYTLRIRPFLRSSDLN